MRMNELNQVGQLSPNDLILMWNGSQNRTAPFSLVTEAARDAVFALINMPGGLDGLGAARSGKNSDITGLLGITTSRIATDLNTVDATGWFLTGIAAANQPENKQFLVWNQQGDTNNIAQMAISLDSGKMYTRKRSVPAGQSAAVWSAWKVQLQAGDVTTDTIGAGATGKQLIAAATAAAARTALGATTTGSNLLMSADAAGARTVIGMTTTGSAIVTAGTQLDAMTAIGMTTFGRQVVQAADSTALRVLTGMVATWRALTSTDSPTADMQTAAQGAMGFTDTGKALVAAADAAAVRTAIGALPDAKATSTVRGGVLLAPAQTDLTAAPTQDDFNGLLAKLRTAGVLATA